jgi:hypothetical protein
MKTKAVIDRIDSEKATILVGDDQERLVITKSLLPPGSKEGDWLKVDIEDDHIFKVEKDKETTAQSKSRIASKLDQLRKK